MINNSAIANLIREKKVPQIFSILETQQKQWMLTMDYGLAKLVVTWQLDMNLALTKVRNQDSFKGWILFYKSKLWV